MTEDLTVVIASPLEAEYVARIAAVPGVRVLHDPALIPSPTYVADHKGVHPALDDEQLARWRGMLAEADVLWDFDWQDANHLADHAPKLRWVQATSSGVGQVLVRFGITETPAYTITTAAGVHAVPLAEFALTGILHVVKGLPMLRRLQAERTWQRYTTRQVQGLHTVVVGLGTVGRESVRLLAAAGLEVTAVGRDGRSYDVPGATRVIGMSQLDELLPATDALVLCCPLTDETRGLMDEHRFGLLQHGAALVNIARGGVVDEPAMLAALESGRLGGAALDVFAAEPLPTDSPLWARDDVLVSPHSASTVDQENGRILEIFLDNLERFRSGREMRNVYDPARGY
ncbi:D-2-hydroxyacid dehydrogenase [Microbacterium sp. NPDC079995]|uniref:D-2-hydroxyacid dehydrogenase n=1 Tax=unclassified Microbacterium TaxID=2609290 RepID=UPI00344C4E09